MKVMSIDFFLPEEAPTIWRGPLKMRAIRQFLVDIVWGELDFLFIDLPPGTGDEPLSIAQLLPDIDGVVIVTMPTGLSSSVVKKAITFAERTKHADHRRCREHERLYLSPLRNKNRDFRVRRRRKNG